MSVASVNDLDEVAVMLEKKKLLEQLNEVQAKLARLEAAEKHVPGGPAIPNEESDSTVVTSVAGGPAPIAGVLTDAFALHCISKATVYIHGEATALMQETNSATLLCRIGSPMLRGQIKTFLEQNHSDAFGLCTYHKLESQPWFKENVDKTNTALMAEIADKQPDSIMCCIRAEYAFEVEDCLICEVTFVKNGKLVYVEDVAALGEEFTKSAGEGGSYLGVYDNMYQSAKPFEINIETTRPLPVLACTQFKSAKTLHDELARRASYFLQEELLCTASGVV